MTVKEQLLKDLTNKVLTALNKVDDGSDDPEVQLENCFTTVEEKLKTVVDKLFSNIDQAIIANEQKWCDKFGPVFSKTPERPDLISCSDVHALLNLKCQDLMVNLGTPIGQAYSSASTRSDK